MQITRKVDNFGPKECRRSEESEERRMQDEKVERRVQEEKVERRVQEEKGQCSRRKESAGGER